MTQRFPLTATLQAATIFTLMSTGVNLHAQSASPDPTGSHHGVPVTEVVLFSSGVGYFQHEGTVQGDSQAELRFKTSQINDILKSLVLQDLDGGHVGTVTYPSQDPLAKTLGSFQVDISDNPSLGELLDKLRGARILLAYNGPGGLENFPGTILGVEKKQVSGGKDGANPLEKSFLNLVTDRGIRSLELDRVDKLELQDPGLQDELNRALAAVAGARDQDKKPVEIHFNGTGERHVRIGYVVETPIWRASYRLILPSNDSKTGKDAKNAKGTLQGWAIVENQTDNDWNNVSLSLVSGRPISFIENLYTPLYVPRPTVTPELYASLRPREYDAGMNVAAAGPPHDESFTDGITGGAAPQAARARAMLRSAAMPGMSTEAATPAPAQFEKRSYGGSSINATDSIVPLSETAKLGDLFQYTIGNITLSRQRSAMIPIINDPMPVEKLSIYNESVLSNHPLNGVRLTNDSDAKLHLLQGPVTVFDENRYAGDARLEDLPPGQNRLLSYGIDLQTDVIARDLQSQQSVQTGKIVRGVLLVTRKFVSAKEYYTDNKSDRDKTLVLEHPVRDGWKLTDTPAPIETTDKLYRFQQAVPAGRTEKLTVREENVQGQNIALLPLDLPSLLSYRQTGEIPAPVRDALTKAAGLKQASAQTQNEIDERNAQITSISQDQNRLRENIKTVDKASAYATRLLKKLDDQESQLEKLRAENDGLRTRLDEQNRALADYLNNLNVG